MVNEFNAQIRTMVNEFYTNVWRMINDFVFAAMTWGIMFHRSYIWRMVNEFDAQIGAVVNYLHPPVQRKSLTVRLAGYGAIVLVYDDLFKVNLLRTRADERQGGENDGQKQCFHSVQMLLKGF